MKPRVLIDAPLRHMQAAASNGPSPLPRLYGIIGYPLGHSLSPAVHNTGFRTLGIDAIYLRWPVLPDSLYDFLHAVKILDIQGCSVTIPHKTAIIPMLDGITPLAEKVGAVNTLYRDGDQVLGDNTDVAGFRSLLNDLSGQTVLLLGAGGAAHAAAFGLQDLSPAKVYIATPSNTSHLPLAESFGFEPIPWGDRHTVAAHMVINATFLGMQGERQGDTPYDFSKAPAPDDSLPLTAYDIVYNPRRTRFLAEAEEAGRRPIPGIEMFWGQAEAQFRLWTKRQLPPAAKDALIAALEGKDPTEGRGAGQTGRGRDERQDACKRPDGGRVKILVLHGVNLGMFGRRDPDVYGNVTLQEIDDRLERLAQKLGVEVETFQTDDEATMIRRIHQTLDEPDIKGIVINPGAWAHYSIALRDALEIPSVPAVEVHMSNVHAREPFRQTCLTASACQGAIAGLGPESYELGLRAVCKLVTSSKR
jgi:shikimate dehydrogenase